jgi:DNA-3-methyladenine glycosylase
MPQGPPLFRKVSPAFFERPALQVAPALLGLTLVHRHQGLLLRSPITETEAYLGPRDKAAHASRGRGPKPGHPHAQPGRAYVYISHGLWPCLNVVTGGRPVPQCVLFRGIEGAQGPGRLCRAMKIGKSLDGAPFQGDELWIEQPWEGLMKIKVLRGVRIGLGKTAEGWQDRRWRFTLEKGAL